ncbi:DUF4386 domain-containing protein [Paenibacillus sp. GCM10023252]|uniref:DUF4386 domain-containing protein n=1 Tax=Paenibacillus sp. GCM10023252 TaxID=3252649 RepID=UPI0036064009
MNSASTAARTTGVLFILATVSAIAGLVLYDPILQGPDYLSTGAAHANQILLGTVLELVLIASAIGTAITMYPYLRTYNEILALGHVCFRFLEAVVILIGMISVLSLLSLSVQFTATAAPEPASFVTLGHVLRAVHDWTFMLGPNILLGINTMFFCYILYRSKLVPRPLSILGMTGAALVSAAGLFEMFGVFSQISAWGVLMALPVALFEMILAGWLIVRGWKLS